ncbi:MAG TPA: hypothetical protein EYG67_00145 [Campylobacterales bacterium]|nr:hypothetical protein [Campylobacterales bacterium]HIP41053.1 hypothetical protein [Campylobacterales bacterium]
MEFFVQSKQYSVKVFETTIKDEKQFMAFFDANYALFKDHLILITGDLSDEVRTYLHNKPLTFLNNVLFPVGRSRKALEEEMQAKEVEYAVNIQIAETEIAQLSRRLQNNLTVLDEMVRSGQDLSIKGDLLLLNRVNSGAVIHTTGNLIITQIVEGAIRCDGNFLMIGISSTASVIFHGVEVENSLLGNKLNRIELKNSEIIITPVIQKEINWAS